MDAAVVEKIAQKVAHVDTRDHILAWDKAQGGFPHVSEIKDAEGHRRYPEESAPRICQADKKHGRLQIHGSGNMLMCCVARPAPCSYVEPVSR